MACAKGFRGSVLTNNSRAIRNAWHFGFKSALVFTVQWFKFSVSAAHALIGR
nr:DUF3265 domain-containing protein [Vibrio alginolyticus]